MAATTRGGNGVSDLTDQLQNTNFLHLGIAPSATGLVTAGILIHWITERQIPYQATIGPASHEHDGADLSVDIGFSAEYEADLVVTRDEAIPTVIDIGENSRGAIPQWLQQTAHTLNGSSPPGESSTIGVPTSSLALGISLSTQVHGPFSSDEKRVATFCDQYQDDLTSLRTALTLDLLASSPPSKTMATEVENFVASTKITAGPFATSGGTIEVLSVLAQTKPGHALSCVSGAKNADLALEEWKKAATAIHSTIQQAELSNSDDVTIVESSTPAVVSVARLMRRYMDSAPIVVAHSDETVGIAGVDEAAMHAIEGLDTIVSHHRDIHWGRCIDDCSDIADAIRNQL